MNYATDQGMESPTEYADGLIDNYASIPSMGYTDWRKELLRTASQQRYEASVSGGSERTTYYASLGYDKQEGLAKNSSQELKPETLFCPSEPDSKGWQVW